MLPYRCCMSGHSNKSLVNKSCIYAVVTPLSSVLLKKIPNKRCVLPKTGYHMKLYDAMTLTASSVVLRCIQKFQNWPPGARTANGTALYH